MSEREVYYKHKSGKLIKRRFGGGNELWSAVVSDFPFKDTGLEGNPINSIQAIAYKYLVLAIAFNHHFIHVYKTPSWYALFFENFDFVWEIKTERNIKNIELKVYDHTTFVISITEENFILLWNVDTKELMTEISANTENIHKPFFSCVSFYYREDDKIHVYEEESKKSKLPKLSEILNISHIKNEKNQIIGESSYFQNLRLLTTSEQCLLTINYISINGSRDPHSSRERLSDVKIDTLPEAVRESDNEKIYLMSSEHISRLFLICGDYFFWRTIRDTWMGLDINKEFGGKVTCIAESDLRFVMGLDTGKIIIVPTTSLNSSSIDKFLEWATYINFCDTAISKIYPMKMEEQSTLLIESNNTLFLLYLNKGTSTSLEKLFSAEYDISESDLRRMNPGHILFFRGST